MVEAHRRDRFVGQGVPQGDPVLGSAKRRMQIEIRIETFQVLVKKQQMVHIDVARHIEMHFPVAADQFQGGLGRHLLDVQRNTKPARHFEERKERNRLRLFGNALHPDLVGKVSLVYKASMGKRVIVGEKEKPLSRHRAIFERKPQEAHRPKGTVSVAKARHSPVGKFAHFGESLRFVALADRAQDPNVETVFSESGLFRDQAPDAVNRIRRAFVKASKESAAAHRLKSRPIRVDIVARRFLEIEPQSEKPGKKQGAVSFDGPGSLRCGIPPDAIHDRDVLRRFQLASHDGVDIFQDNIIHLHDLRKEDTERTSARRHRLSPAKE